MTSRSEYPLWDHDEDLLEAVRDDGRARVRVRRCDAVEVVIGRGGKAVTELDETAITRDGVPIFRRRGGGCAVVLDPGNIVVSAVTPREGVGDVTASFHDATAWMIAGLTAAGFPGVVGDGVSDLVLENQKVGGSCIYRTRGLVYYSTTLLTAPDLDLIHRYLPHPPREPGYRRGRSHRDFLGSMPNLEAATLRAALPPLVWR